MHLIKQAQFALKTMNNETYISLKINRKKSNYIFRLKRLHVFFQDNTRANSADKRRNIQHDMIPINKLQNNCTYIII